MAKKRKAEPVAMQRLFLFDTAHPTKCIVETDCIILVGEKWGWAETARGRRHLLGTSAFYTLAAAERSKRGALVKIVETRALARMAQTADMYRFAEQQLLMYDQTGHFTPPRKTRVH